MPAGGTNGTTKKERLLAALRRGSVEKAAAEAGISRRTAYRLREADPEFAAAWDEAVEGKIDWVEDKLMALINRGNVVATIFYLKTQGKKRGYIERSEVGVDGDTGRGFDWATAIGAPEAGSVVDPARSSAHKGSNGRAKVGQNGTGRSH